MDSSADPSEIRGSSDTDIPPLPDGLTSGSTILIAGRVDPVKYALDLQILCQTAHGDETAIVVTTIESADRTLATYESIEPDADRPAIKLVDTTADQQYVTALYESVPVVFTPDDLERIVLALTELTGDGAPASGTRHFIVRSLTPLLSNTPTERVCTVLDRITGIRTGDGLGVFGVDYHSHDEQVLTAVTDCVDSVLWVTRDSSNRSRFEFHSIENLTDPVTAPEGHDD